MELFEQELCEVEQAGVRYVLKRDPERVKEHGCYAKGGKKSIEKLCEKGNGYLVEHPRAKAASVLKKVKKKIDDLKISDWLGVIAEGKRLELREDAVALVEEAKLNGCYVIERTCRKR